MKNRFLTLLTSTIVAIAVLTSCSKDDTLLRSQSSSALTNGKMAPDPNGGSVTGTLNPAPVTSDIAVIQGEWLLLGQTTAENGSFIIGNIQPGIYDLRIRYTTSGNSTERVKMINGVTITENGTTDLGVINLD